MIKIAPGKWGYFDQIIFNVNKTTFEGLFCFSQALTILSHIILRLSTLLGYIPSRIYHKNSIKNEKYKKVLTFLALIFRFSFGAIKRNKSLTIYTSKRQFKCDQFVYHNDKDDLIL